jgi:hypothetical protein
MHAYRVHVELFPAAEVFRIIFSGKSTGKACVLLSHDSGARHCNCGHQQLDIWEGIMVRAAKFVSPIFEPSPQHIRQTTAAIRKTWSPKVRASRAVQAQKHVEIMTVSVRALFNGLLGEQH